MSYKKIGMGLIVAEAAVIAVLICERISKKRKRMNRESAEVMSTEVEERNYRDEDDEKLEKLNTILENINAYNGTEKGQKEV